MNPLSLLQSVKKELGGRDRDRTGDPLLANQQLTTIGEELLLSDTSTAET
jgi:hypothetical protein